MWIGSKVPPRIPVCTPPRIGGGWRHQPESTSDVGGNAPQTIMGVDIPAADPNREVNCRLAMGDTTGGDHLTASHLLAGAHQHHSEVGDRDLVPGHRLDRHGEHSGHRPGEGDPSRCRRPHPGTHRGFEVQPPMPGVFADRGEPRCHRAFHRRHETNCDYCEIEDHFLSPATVPGRGGGSQRADR
jgi:hypothetical protein